MENKDIKVKMTTISSANPVHVLKGNGNYKEKDGKILITHYDKENVQTSLIIVDNKVVISRKCDLYSYKIPIKQEETLKGIMGDENTFLVVGKKVEMVQQPNGSTIFLEYDLPDLSDEPVSYKVEIEYKF